MILFVGPLPPPVHGFALINAAMLERFEAAAVVAVFNRAPAVGAGPLGSLFAAVGLWLRFLRQLFGARASAVLYLGLSGGLGQLKDLPFVCAAALLRRPVLVHHHSFAYLRQRPWYARLLLRATRRAGHVVLCESMARALTAAYGIAAERVEVLSNAAFLEPAPALPAPTGTPPRLRLGFLSNISTDKGIWQFFAVGDALADAGVDVHALVAGPVAQEIAPRFARELGQRVWCRHLGAVYGEHKSAFFAAIDVLVFPTLYANEAEPVTVLEALRLGVPVLANARGCIRDLLPRAAGVAFDDEPAFVSLATQTLQAWAAEDAPSWQQRRVAARGAFVDLQAVHAQRVRALVARLAGAGGLA